MRYVSVIFTPEPGQWGLRGDPFLWRLLKERYQAAELPYVHSRGQRLCGAATIKKLAVISHCQLWRRRWGSNPRAGHPTYEISSHASSPLEYSSVCFKHLLL